jgi:L-lactate dehydrogenase (cytochrome)
MGDDWGESGAVGRGYAYGMAAAGDAGIERAVEIFRTDIIRTLKLLGCSSIRRWICLA